MLLPRELPARYDEWNRAWGAPEGRALGRVLPRRLRALPGLAQLTGIFGFQPNSDTRRLEYPWAHEVLDLRPPMRVLEIGGSNSGLQFVLAGGPSSPGWCAGARGPADHRVRAGAWARMAGFLVGRQIPLQSPDTCGGRTHTPG